MSKNLISENPVSKRNLMSIGKMAEINHVTIPTLRLYDELGLLTPRYVDPDSGYRYYDIGQNARLDMIAYMKELGMSLGEIRNVLKTEDISLIEQILAQKNEQIHAQMRELQMRHNAVERAINSLERYRKSPASGTISLEYIDRRLMLGIACPENFYDKDIRCYENMLMLLRDKLKDMGVPQVHSYGVGTSIRKEDFTRGRFIADRIFIFADKQLRELMKGVEIIDSGMYVCIYLDNYDDEIAYARRLMDFCLEKGYTPAGDYICEVMTEFNVFDGETRGMFLRLQLPVTFQA